MVDPTLSLVAIYWGKLAVPLILNMIIVFKCNNYHHHLQVHHLEVPEIINCDEVTIVFSEITYDHSVW